MKDRIKELESEIRWLTSRLEDATAYCSGEFPCEASTMACGLDAELGRLRETVRVVTESTMPPQGGYVGVTESKMNMLRAALGDDNN